MKKSYHRSNYKRNLELLPAILAQYQVDKDHTGFCYSTKKVCKALNISKQTLNRYLHTLEANGIIQYVGPTRRKKRIGYDTSKGKTIRYQFIIPPTKDEVIEALKVEQLNYENNDTVKQSFDNPLLQLIDDIVQSNNKWSPLPITNTCRYEKWFTGKIKKREHIDYRGRVYNQACFQKSGKKKYKDDDYRILRSDYFKALGLNVTSLFDMKSQIPRITAIYNGIHHYEDIPDYYEWFRSECELYKYSRQDVKDVFMRCYFEKDENAAWRHYRTSRMFKADNNWFWRDNKIGWMEADFRKLYQFIWASIKPVGNLIFIITSLIEQTILYRAKKELNVELINVYDEFLKVGSADLEVDRLVIDIVIYISNSIYNIKLNNINISNNILPHDTTTANITAEKAKVIHDTTTQPIDTPSIVIHDTTTEKAHKIITTPPMKVIHEVTTDNTLYTEWQEHCKSLGNDPEACWSFEEYIQLKNQLKKGA
jgi:predicted transcriptional regulator